MISLILLGLLMFVGSYLAEKNNYSEVSFWLFIDAIFAIFIGLFSFFIKTLTF